MRTLITTLFVVAFVIFGCNTTRHSHALKLNRQHKVHFLNKAEAGISVTKDVVAHYFDFVQPIEISIQTKTSLDQLPTNRAELLKYYKAYLSADTEAFSSAEIKKIEPIVEEIFSTCEKYAPGLFPKQLKLIKTKGECFGEGVYFTRENCIVIPQDGLDHFQSIDFRNTMYHEIWHIISRYHPDLQREAYALIGFSPLDMNSLNIPDKVKSHIIYNPDGIDLAWKIQLTDTDGKKKWCMPILHTDTEGYQKGKDAFFDYLRFNLYIIDKGTLITKPDGLTSPIDIEKERSFTIQVTDNTGYIIHPDELLADNFRFVMTTSHDIMSRQKFSQAGNKLLSDLEKLLKPSK